MLPAMAAERQYDLALFGATGFTGGLTARYLAENAPPSSKWALVGRNRRKLEAVRAELAARPAKAPPPELLEADASDATALTKVAEAARVVATTVGPYALYGAPLVAACAAAGTDYVDLTGEPEFVDRMWVEHHAEAERSGARLVHCCGFDSIPHDLGVYFTVKQLPEGVPLRVDGYVRSAASFSGGTYHSAINGFARFRQTIGAARERRRAERRPEHRKVHSASPRLRRDPELGGWVAPLPTIDGAVIRRSAAALERYGPDFTYGHHLVSGPFLDDRRDRRRRWRGRRFCAAAPDPQAAAEDQIAGGGAGRGRAGEELVQGPLRRRGRRQACRHGGLRRRSRLRRDLEDARRVGTLPRLRRVAGDGRAGDDGDRHG
jgi:short subunit dehydrogenase-like uncharacterized protein